MLGIEPTKPESAIIFAAMPLYHFAVHNGHLLDDPEATESLPDDEAAHEHALQVIRDLKRNNETAWKAWTIVVTDGDRLVRQIPFVGDV
jgi:hypothetical protein